MTVFTFVRVQAGYWGESELRRTLKIKAESAEVAEATVRNRADYVRRLANGDRQFWRLEAAY